MPTSLCWFPVSTHAPLAGSDFLGLTLCNGLVVSTHAPLAGSDGSARAACQRHGGFNPRSPCGERPLCCSKSVLPGLFQPTLPLRGATRCLVEIETNHRFQPTLPLRGATLDRDNRDGEHLGVSTHAPLAGSDSRQAVTMPSSMMFQPTLPLRGATWVVAPKLRRGPLFQPTLPLRGATASTWCSGSRDCKFQPTLPLRGATIADRYGKGEARFQPTLPLRGATRRSRPGACRHSFQPTLPLRGATAGLLHSHAGPGVSTHAPLAGSDRPPSSWGSCPTCFNPRSPCGERRSGWVDEAGASMFQPTLPLRGATTGTHTISLSEAVSTHAPLAGSDDFIRCLSKGQIMFQPTLPLRGATVAWRLTAY